MPAAKDDKQAEVMMQKNIKSIITALVLCVFVTDAFSALTTVIIRNFSGKTIQKIQCVGLEGNPPATLKLDNISGDVFALTGTENCHAILSTDNTKKYHMVSFLSDQDSPDLTPDRIFVYVQAGQKTEVVITPNKQYTNYSP